MGISDKVSQIAGQVQDGVKNSSVSLIALSLKTITALMIGLTMALVAQVLMDFGTFSFIFFMAVVVGIVWKMISPWRLGSVLIFDLICVLVGLLLRLYITVAP